jgi:hypothetical protein
VIAKAMGSILSAPWNGKVLPARGREPSFIEAAYLAGIFDGEGSLHELRVVRMHGEPRRKYQVAIANTDESLMDWLSQFGGKVHFHKVVAGHLGKKPVYYWRTERKAEVIRFLTFTLPYLIVKRESAAKALAYLFATEKEREEWG